MDTMSGYEREVQDKQGRWHLLRIRPYRTLENTIDGTVVALVDIDTLKRNHETLLEADRHKDEFLAMLGHELRNPLAPLRNVVALLKSPGATAADRERALAIMDRQIHKMVRLIDDLLNVSRITLSQIDLRTETVDVGALVRRMADQSEASFQSRGQTLHLALPSEPLYVNADPVRLEQVMANLLDNASKYTGERGNVWVAVEQRPGTDDAAGAKDAFITVKDDGIGIDAGKLPHVFDLFMRATRPADHKYGGLGVGLTLVRRLIELHGGTVLARSEGEGRGSEFTVRLPTVPARVSEAPPVAAARASAEVARRVLIVDDNIDNAESLAMVLRDGPHETKIANSGPVALEISAQFRPDAAIIDIGMPDMDGYEVARRLRRLNGSEKTRLIALSGYGDESARGRAWEAGFDEYLVKPVDTAKILELIGGG
jgi:two-component system CheB/CheR fusion protein